MPFQRQRYEVRIKVNGEDQLLKAFAGEIKATRQEAEHYYQRAIAAWEKGDTREWFTTPWTEICLVGPDGLFERHVRANDPDTQ